MLSYVDIGLCDAIGGLTRFAWMDVYMDAWMENCSCGVKYGYSNYLIKGKFILIPVIRCIIIMKESWFLMIVCVWMDWHVEQFFYQRKE